MGKINLQKTIVGGLVAGLVLNVVDYVLFGVVLKNDFNAALQALNKPAMTSQQIIWYVILDFLFGMFLVWLYAAIRPRFGAGPRTAVYAGLAFWVGFALSQVAQAVGGLFPTSLYVIPIVVGLVEFPLAALAGGKFYTEMA